MNFGKDDNEEFRSIVVEIERAVYARLIPPYSIDDIEGTFQVCQVTSNNSDTFKVGYKIMDKCKDVVLRSNLTAIINDVIVLF